MIALGSLVAWSSSAAGVTRTKRGVVVEVVPPHTRPIARVGDGDPRDHESYVVRATVDGRTGERLYWPRVAGLEVIS